MLAVAPRGTRLISSVCQVPAPVHVLGLKLSTLNSLAARGYALLWQHDALLGALRRGTQFSGNLE